jgi:hypothetical protein
MLCSHLGNVEMAAILKILKTKCTTLSNDLFLCEVSKGYTVRFPRNVPDKIDAEERWFAMAATLNPKWPPYYKNPPIWAKFDFQVDYDVAN